MRSRPNYPDHYRCHRISGVIWHAKETIRQFHHVDDCHLTGEFVRVAFGITNFRNYRIRALLYAGKPNWNLRATLTPRQNAECSLSVPGIGPHVTQNLSGPARNRRTG